jgi:hypothetical protein
MLVVGVGLGLAIGPAATLVAEGVRATETGVATSLNSVMRRVGGALGGQVAAALLAAFTLLAGEPSEGAFVIGFLVSAGVAIAGIACAGIACALAVPGGRPA